MRKLKDNEENLEEINYNIRDLKIKDIIPNVIDNFLVTMIDGHHTIVLPSTITGLQLNAWLKQRGGVFSKDVLNYSLGQKYGQYIHIKGNELNCIARLITEDEEFSFSTMKLIDGKIKDISYMILRHLKEDDLLTNTQKNIIEKDFYVEVDPIILYTSKNNSNEDDTEYHTGSISLFNE